MFNGHQGGNGGSDMNVGSQNSMGYHQRNQTQITVPAADSIFRSSIMSSDVQAQAINSKKQGGVIMNRYGP